jgi:hypothetical protein
VTQDELRCAILEYLMLYHTFSPDAIANGIGAGHDETFEMVLELADQRLVTMREMWSSAYCALTKKGRDEVAAIMKREKRWSDAKEESEI